jgi:hypothetical protein
VKSSQGLVTVAHGHHLIVLASKHGGQKLKGQVIVFSDQNPGGQSHVRKTIMEAE